tara:strand:+ start:719 stop:940 length:222 start_codon:yes stop_codon:yes gene_type:complete
MTSDRFRAAVLEAMSNAPEAPTRIPISAETFAAFREEFRKIGPRHRNVDRWEHDLGWTIDPRVADDYLALDYQ